MATQVKSALARPVRSATQGGAGLVATQFVDAFIHHLNEQQYGVLTVVLGVLIGWLQVTIENKVGVGFLREPEVRE